VAWFSDSHAGNRFGLMRPGIELLGEDNETLWSPAPTATQRLLWSYYEADVAWIADYAKGDRIILVHNGDLTDGSKYPTEKVSTRQLDQYMIAVDNLLPWLALPNLAAVRLTLGTAAHNMGEGTAEGVVCEHLKAKYPERNIGTVAHGLLNVDGRRFDYAHHGPGSGSRQWLRGNILRYYTRSMMLEELLHGNRPPDVVARSHYHDFVHETVRLDGKEEYVTEAFVLPAYCGMTEHSRQATKSVPRISCGMVACEVVDGRLRDFCPRVRTIDLRREETL
jgi:hypothetical protein